MVEAAQCLEDLARDVSLYPNRSSSLRVRVMVIAIAIAMGTMRMKMLVMMTLVVVLFVVMLMNTTDLPVYAHVDMLLLVNMLVRVAATYPPKNPSSSLVLVVLVR